MPITKGNRRAAGPDRATIAAALVGPGPSGAARPRHGGMATVADPDQGPAPAEIVPREIALAAHGPAETAHAKAAAPAADPAAGISARGKMPAPLGKRRAPHPRN